MKGKLTLPYILLNVAFGLDSCWLHSAPVRVAFEIGRLNQSSMNALAT